MYGKEKSGSRITVNTLVIPLIFKHTLTCIPISWNIKYIHVCILYVNTFVNTYVSYVNHIYTTPTDLYKIWSITKPSWHNKNTQQINLSPLTPLKKSPPAPLVVDLIGEEVSRLQWVETTLPKTNHETMRFENPIRIHPPICISMVPSWLSHVSGRSYECQ